MSLAPVCLPFRRFVLAALALLALCCGQASAEHEAPHSPTVVIDRAELSTPNGVRSVSLPNVLERADYDPKGGRVRYRLAVNLPAAPEARLGIYVPKMSLSGTLFLNDHDIGSCETGALEWLRCLHKPYLFTPPRSLWRSGENIIEIELYATDSQMNGLAPVQVGDAAELEAGPYRTRYLLQVALTRALTLISLVLGLIAISVALRLRGEPIYFWFAITSLVNAIANINGILARSFFDVSLYSWFIYSSRFVSAPLLGLMVLAFFGKDKSPAWLRRSLIAYCFIGPILAGLFGNNRYVFAAIYVPLFVTGAVVLALMIKWTWQSRRILHVFAVGMFVAILVTGGLDWLRLAGSAPLESLYLLNYVYSGIMLVTGALLVNIMASSITDAREMRETLEEKVADRTAQLTQALQNIEEMERTALTLTENIPIGTFTMERDANDHVRFDFISNRFLQMLGISRDTALAEPFTAFRSAHPDEYEGFMAIAREAFFGKHSFEWTGRIVVDDKTRWVNVESVARALENGNILWEGVIIDVTAHKEAEDALKQTGEALLAIETARSRLEEREMLLRDMHDGFGSQLTSLRYLASENKMNPPELAKALTECMSDLYLVVDTLSSADNTLADAMADFRFRTERRMAESRMTMHWDLQICDIPLQPQRITLQILRIVQEAVNNALKHSQAKTIWLRAAYDMTTRGLTISIADNGVGIAQDVRHGRGLINMARRARELGAELEWRARTPGTDVVFTLTFAEAEADAQTAQSA